MTAWIEMLPDAAAEDDPALKRAFEMARAPSGKVENVMRVHSLRPHTMVGHVALYRATLHNEENQLPLWFLETVGALTAFLNNCAYSYTNHWTNAAYLIDDEARAAAVRAALEGGRLEDAFAGKELALLAYTRKLTLDPGAMEEADVIACREAGASDGEILEVNQTCGYFNYVSRHLNGLGVTLKGDTIGYYGHDDEPKTAPRGED